MTIYEQIKAYCNCEEKINNNDIDEINLASVLTCWADSKGSTLLKEEREEYIELGIKPGSIYNFQPKYIEYDLDSFSFKLEIFNVATIEKEIVDIKQEDYLYDEATKQFYIKLDEYIPQVECTCDFICNPCKLENIKYRLIVNYNAGYELLPEFLLPVFCDMVEIVHAKNICVCPSCNSCDKASGREGQVIYYADGDVITVSLKEKLGEKFVNSYITQLSYLSLCKRDYLIGSVV